MLNIKRKSLWLGGILFLGFFHANVLAEALVIGVQGPKTVLKRAKSIRTWTLQATRRGIRLRLVLDFAESYHRTKKKKKWIDFKIPRRLKRNRNLLELETAEKNWVPFGRFLPGLSHSQGIFGNLEVLEGVDVSLVENEVFLFIEPEVSKNSSVEALSTDKDENTKKILEMVNRLPLS